MRYLLDTNILSEIRKEGRGDPGLQSWFHSVDGRDLAISVLALGEIRLGVLRLEPKDPATAQHLMTWLLRVESAFRGRTLSVDAMATEIWARWNSIRSLPIIDSLQAATAVAHGMTFVTRNVRDLKEIDVDLLNPFND